MKSARSNRDEKVSDSEGLVFKKGASPSPTYSYMSLITKAKEEPIASPSHGA